MKIKNLTTSDLAAELARRQKGAARLQVRRDKLLAQLTGIENELRDLGLLDGSPPRAPGRPKGTKAPTSRGKRPKNKLTLVDALAGCAEVGAVVSPAEAAELVQSNGYRSSSATFGAQVANALAKHKGFKKQGRGAYERVG